MKLLCVALLVACAAGANLRSGLRTPAATVEALSVKYDCIVPSRNLADTVKELQKTIAGKREQHLKACVSERAGLKTALEGEKNALDKKAEDLNEGSANVLAKTKLAADAAFTATVSELEATVANATDVANTTETARAAAHVVLTAKLGVIKVDKETQKGEKDTARKTKGSAFTAAGLVFNSSLEDAATLYAEAVEEGVRARGASQKQCAKAQTDALEVIKADADSVARLEELVKSLNLCKDGAAAPAAPAATAATSLLEVAVTDPCAHYEDKIMRFRSTMAQDGDTKPAVAIGVALKAATGTARVTGDVNDMRRRVTEARAAANAKAEACGLAATKAFKAAKEAAKGRQTEQQGDAAAVRAGAESKATGKFQSKVDDAEGKLVALEASKVAAQATYDMAQGKAADAAAALVAATTGATTSKRKALNLRITEKENAQTAKDTADDNVEISTAAGKKSAKAAYTTELKSVNSICTKNTGQLDNDINDLDKMEAHMASLQVGHNGTLFVDCVVSKWSDWGKCSSTCGAAVRTRTREVTKQASYGGDACPRNLAETEDCKQAKCTKLLLTTTISSYGHAPCGADAGVAVMSGITFNALVGKTYKTRTQKCREVAMEGDAAVVKAVHTHKGERPVIDWTNQEEMAGSAIETGELNMNIHGWAHGKFAFRDGERKACEFDKQSDDTCEEAASKSCVIEKGKDGKCKAGTAHWGEVSWTFTTVDV